MGVFLYSNQKIDTYKVKRVFETRGHKNIQCNLGNNGMTIVYAPKIIVKNTNYLGPLNLGGGKDDFAIGIGTFFYKGTYGETALKKVYEDLEIVLSENQVYGHWAFCIHKGDTTYVFNDMSGFCRLFSYEQGDQVVITTSMLGAIATMHNPKFDKVKLAGFLTNTYASETNYICNLKNVDPLKYLVVKDGKSPRWIQRNIHRPKRIEEFDEAVTYVKNLFDEQIRQLKPVLENVKVYSDATGGLDSRLISSVLKSNNIDFDYINYPIYGPDSEIARMLADGIHRKLHTQTNITCRNNYSEHYGEYDFCNNFLRQYPNGRWILENDFEFSGARGECLDLPDIYTDEDISYMKNPKITSLVQHLMVKSVMTKEMQNKYAEYSIKLIEERMGVKADQIMSEQQQSKFCQLLGGEWVDGMYNSSAQAICYFYSIYNEWHFNHSVSNLAFYKVKGNRRLSLKLISLIDPELGSFPFVSRLNTRRNSVNETEELPMEYNVYPRWLKKIIPIWLKNILICKMGVRKVSYDKSLLQEIDFSLYSDVLKVNDLQRYPNVYKNVLNRLYSVEIIRKIMDIQF